MSTERKFDGHFRSFEIYLTLKVIRQKFCKTVCLLSVTFFSLSLINR